MMRNTPERAATLRACFADTTGAPRIKLCGMTRAQDIDAVNQAKPDFSGFIINVKKSHRNLSPEDQRYLVKNLNPQIYAVGVLVDAPLDQALALAQSGCFDALQLHGQEDASYLEALGRRTSIPLIQAFQLSQIFDVAALETSPADMILLDSGSGSGKQFDWTLIPPLKRPFMLAGGLTPETIKHALSQARPWGVDLSSGIETNNLKDANKILAAVHAIRRSA